MGITIRGQKAVELMGLLAVIHNEKYKITREERAYFNNVASLDLQHAQITNLAGIENLSGLEKLDLSFTQITSLAGIENLSHLQELDLSGTQITSLEGIENLHNLRALNLSGLHLRELPRNQAPSADGLFSKTV